MAFNYLEDYAKRNIWCSPNQDKQAIIEPARVVGAPGNIGYFYLNNRRYTLPDLSQRYYVYMVGRLSPDRIGILPVTQIWKRLDECCNEQQMVIQVYAASGLSIPLHRCFYRFNSDGNLLFAIPQLAKIAIDLATSPIYIKFYSNAYFLTNESAPIDDQIRVEGMVSTGVISVVNFQNAVQPYLTNPLGKALFYVNGRRVDRVWPGNTATGDIIEMVYDGTVRELFQVTVRELQQFDSLLDTERKYLVLNPTVMNSIDFLDDLEFYLWKDDTATLGVYYHKNLASSVRMVTHQDYAIRVDSVVALSSTLGVADPEDMVLEVIIRKGGYTRPLVTNAHRTHELFKLPFEERKRAMLGIDSNVSVWRADVLENSDYTRLMRQLFLPLNKAVVDNALGYNAMSVILGNSPLKPIDQSGIKSVHLPYGMLDHATVYEYDSEGRYLRHNVHHGLGEDAVVGVDCALIEVVSGAASDAFDDQYAQAFTLNPSYEYRFYKAPDVGNLDDLVWTDVTGSSDYVLNANGLGGVWSIDLNAYKVIVRSDAKFVHRAINHSTLYGTIEILLNEVEGGLQSRMHIPPGTLDVLLNDYTMVRGIDYHYTFPKVTVVNKSRLVNPGVATQRVIFRAMAFPRPDLSMEELDDVGFITRGRLSANSRFDLRDDKVQQIVIGGKVHFRDEIPFRENSETSPYLDSMNGVPYHVKDVIVPTRKLTLKTTTQLREEALAVDQAISAYLSLKLPEELDNSLYTIPEKYQVVSPFFARITVLTRAGVIPPSMLEGHLTDAEVLALVGPYFEFLEHDPTQADLLPDERFVTIIPHFYNYVVDLSPYQYRFLSRVNKLICNDRLDMSHFYTISS